MCRADTFLAALAFESVEKERPDIFAGPSQGLIHPRETKVLSMVARGKTNDEIARELRLSTRTVKRTLRLLFDQFGVSNRTELSCRAATLYLVKSSH
jgi:DNA-binding NarL/FixJ family response regulator